MRLLLCSALAAACTVAAFGQTSTTPNRAQPDRTTARAFAQFAQLAAQTLQHAAAAPVELPAEMTALPELIEALRQVRREGVAFDREEFIPGVICIGAPIRDQAGAVIGAISASMPKMRATDEHMAMTRAEILSATRALSEDYGAAPEAGSEQTTKTTIPN